MFPIPLFYDYSSYSEGETDCFASVKRFTFSSDCSFLKTYLPFYFCFLKLVFRKYWSYYEQY